jgi:hypothetical protein
MHVKYLSPIYQTTCKLDDHQNYTHKDNIPETRDRAVSSSHTDNTLTTQIKILLAASLHTH